MRERRASAGWSERDEGPSGHAGQVEARERLVKALINKKKKANPPGTNHVLSMLQALINQLPALTTY